MRRRELIRRLREDLREIRKTQTTWNGSRATTQANDAERQRIFHDLEACLPDIILKLEESA